MIYFLLHVDDMLIACKEIGFIDKVKCILKSEFEMKELGPARRIPGTQIHIYRKNRLLFLSQTYISKILTKLGMDKLKSSNTPIAQHFRLFVSQPPKNECERDFMQKIPLVWW